MSFSFLRITYSLKAMKILVLFASSWFCNFGLSSLTEIKSKKWETLLKVDDKMRTCLTILEPRFNLICSRNEVQLSCSVFSLNKFCKYISIYIYKIVSHNFFFFCVCVFRCDANNSRIFLVCHQPKKIEKHCFNLYKGFFKNYTQEFQYHQLILSGWRIPFALERDIK